MNLFPGVWAQSILHVFFKSLSSLINILKIFVGLLIFIDIYLLSTNKFRNLFVSRQFLRLISMIGVPGRSLVDKVLIIRLTFASELIFQVIAFIIGIVLETVGYFPILNLKRFFVEVYHVSAWCIHFLILIIN